MDALSTPRRTLGPGGPAVSALSLGSWQIWDRIAFDDAVELLGLAVSAGINFFDVAHYDHGPHREGSDTDVLLGRTFAAAGVERDDYVLGEKLWLWNYPTEALDEQLRRALERVGTDRADLVVLGDFVGELDVPRVVSDVAALIASGSAGAWGFNNWAAADAEAAVAFAVAEGLPAPVLAQLKYSVCRRAVADGEPYRRVFEQLGVGLQPSDVFEGGILAGRKSERRIGMDPGGIRAAIQAAVPGLREVAEEFDATPAQAALAFCLAHPATISVLHGASRREQLLENLGALELAARHGMELRARLEPLWADRGVVQPDASWGATRDEALRAGRT